MPLPAPEPPPAASPAPAVPDLLPLVQGTLQRGRFRRPFPPALEARYEADTGPARSRHLVRMGLVSLFVYNLFLVNDAIARPEVLWVAVLYRTGVMGVAGLLVLAAVSRGLAPRWREGLMGGVLVLCMDVSCRIFDASSGVAAQYDPFLVTLIMLVGNIVFALRLWVAVASSAACLAVGAAYVLGDPRVPAVAQQFWLAMMVATGIFTALACARLESAERHGYLLLLQEALRSEAAHRRADVLAHISQTDALTLLPNRRAFDAELDRRWQEAAADGRSIGLVLVDVDQFKLYNDLYGHPAGDAGLREVARAMAGAVRQGDLLARIGGEEFALLLVDAGAAEAAHAAERLRAAVQALALPHAGNGDHGVVTVSLGVAAVPAVAGTPAHTLVAAADAALYAAKRGGRNRWSAASEATAEAGC